MDEYSFNFQHKTLKIFFNRIKLKSYDVKIITKRSCWQRFIILNYDCKSDSSDGCHLWFEIAVTAVTPIVTNALPTRIFDSDGSFKSDGTPAK